MCPICRTPVGKDENSEALSCVRVSVILRFVEHVLKQKHCAEAGFKIFSKRLEDAIQNDEITSWTKDRICPMKLIESEYENEADVPKSGYFIYLLIDVSALGGQAPTFEEFASAIFYVGKGIAVT